MSYDRQYNKFLSRDLEYSFIELNTEDFFYKNAQYNILRKYNLSSLSYKSPTLRSIEIIKPNVCIYFRTSTVQYPHIWKHHFRFSINKKKHIYIPIS